MTENEIAELTGALSDLETMWRTVPTEAKRGFGDLVLPAGYTFQKVRTAEKGLLFKTFGASAREASDVVRYVRLHWNQVITELQEWQRLQNLVISSNLAG